MDETQADAVFARLLALGLAEERADGVRSSRSWNVALQRASDRLNRRVAETGVMPEGNPLVLAVEDALAAEAVPVAPEERRAIVEVLVLLELVNMSPEKRVQLGFGHVAL